MGRRSRSVEEDGGGHDGGGMLRWLLTYADMITLLMAFFIMMYSMSILNLNKFQEVAISIRSGFAGLTEGQGRSIMGSSGQFGVKPSPIIGESVGVPFKITQGIQNLIEKEDMQKAIKLRAEERGLVISLVTNKMVFESGGATLSPEARQTLIGIAGLLNNVPNQIRVEGHTCNLPTRSQDYPTNWELSTSRATNVIRFLIESGKVPADRLSAAGYADTKPLDGIPNTSNENRAMNRRVDIVVLKAGYN